MTVPLAANPAVTNPRAALTAAQQDALCAVGFYKDQRLQGRAWIVGNKRFARATISALQRAGLLAGNGRGVWPTMAGQLAISKLRGELQ